MDNKQRATRDRDLIDVEAMKRQLSQVSEDVPRMTGHYVQAVEPQDPHVFNYLYTAKALIDQANQQLSHVVLWLTPDDADEVPE